MTTTYDETTDLDLVHTLNLAQLEGGMIHVESVRHIAVTWDGGPAGGLKFTEDEAEHLGRYLLAAVAEAREGKGGLG